MARLTINKNYSSAVLNFIRCVGLTMTKEWRPIGFTAGSASTVLEVGDNVEEDMTEFTNNVCSCKFVSNSENDLVVWSGTFNSVLNASDIRGDITSLDSKELLHSLKPDSATIYFRRSNGMHTESENRKYLTEQGINVERVVTVASRHSLIDNFTFVEIAREGDNIIFEVNTESAYGFTVDNLLMLSNIEFNKVLN